MWSENSITSNNVKLLKHMKKLYLLQSGKISPIMVHIMPTHRCQLNCVHCCFKNRKHLNLDLDFPLLKIAINQFYELGVRSVELTGGGEPTLYPYILDALDYFKSKKLNVGLITNGLEIERIANHLKDLSWVRLSLNPIDYEYDLNPAMDILNKSGVPVSFCYIWNRFSIEKIKEVAKFAQTYKIECRISADCINHYSEILRQSWEIDFHINEMSYLFAVHHKAFRKNDDCRIWMVKPALYTDGWIYPCPSAELAYENKHQINEDIRLCHGSEILKFFNSTKPKSFQYNCSFCKYADQQELLENILMETKFNEFA